MSSTIKKNNAWITSSFGHFTSVQSSQSKGGRPHKRKNDDRTFEESQPGPSGLLDSCKVATASMPWTEKYSPITENDLAVNKKKVAEVRDWLLSNLTSVSKRNNSNILVLTGPAGAGKSATIDVLKRDLNIEVQEWSTSVTNTSEEFSAWKDFRVLSADSQKKQFQDFLLRANKYPTLSISGQESTTSVPGQKIVLVEELPNVFCRNLTDFHEILRRFHATCRNPLVFIISDSYISESSVYSLFPKRIQIELNITCISFNAIANSSLIKALNKIMISESQMTTKNMKTATKDAVDLIVSSANGDIRSCINSLQFYCTNESASKKCFSTPSIISSKNKPVDKSKTNPKPSNEDNALLSGRDTSLFLFKALGKILYCKREPMGDSETSKKLPKHLTRYKRDKLLIDPEEIVEKTHFANDVFNLYLHQNYLGFYSNIGDIADASQYFSDADIITGHWSTRDALKSYSSSIATRGVIFSNSHRSSSITGAVSGGWRPLQKPQWFEAFKEENSNKKTAEDLFYDLRHPAVDLHTDVLPFVAKTNIPLRTPSHIAFVQMVTRFNINVFRSSSTLGQNENDAADEVSTEVEHENNSKTAINQCEDESISISQILVETQQSNEDVNNYEEGLIEDFSDDDDFAELLFI